MKSSVRKIAHIDADCFYAAIEMRDNPALRGKPIAVGGSPTRRGVVATCNYAARAFGVHSAMATSQAIRLCPSLEVIPTNMSKYRDISKQMRDIFLRYTELIEPLSLDEAYLDLSDNEIFDGSATLVAEAIRSAVRSELGITVSAGVSVNKFVAKVASDWRKPDGLTVVCPDSVDAFVAALPVKCIPGVGRVTEAKLARHGYRLCSDLRCAERVTLNRRFGSFGETLYQRSRGMDDRPVQSERARKSVSTEATFAADLLGEAACAEALTGLLGDLELRIKSASIDHAAGRPFVKIKFVDFTVTTVERAGNRAVLEDYLCLLREGLRRRPLPVRLLGIGIRLSGDSREQLPLL